MRAKLCIEGAAYRITEIQERFDFYLERLPDGTFSSKDVVDFLSAHKDCYLEADMDSITICGWKACEELPFVGEGYNVDLFEDTKE